MLYDLVEDKDKRSITEQIGASEVWATIIQAKEQKLDYNRFEDLISKRSSTDINDLDTKAFLEDIYNSCREVDDFSINYYGSWYEPS